MFSILSARITFLCAVVAVVLVAAADPVTAQSREVWFSGIPWEVRDSGGAVEGPGANVWTGASRNVRVVDGELHLVLEERDGRAASVEVLTRHPVPGYGRYSFVLETPDWQIDPFLVLGFFMYQNRGAEVTPQEYEIDVELSYWGIPGSPLGHFVLMYRHPGDSVSRVPPYSFEVPTHFEATGYEIDWQPDRIGYRAWGITPDGREVPIADTVIRDERIHTLHAQRLHINFWLYGQPVVPPGWRREIVIREVSLCTDSGEY